MIIGLGLLFKELDLPGRAKGYADVISNINFGAFLIPQEILINSGSTWEHTFQIDGLFTDPIPQQIRQNTSLMYEG